MSNRLTASRADYMEAMVDLVFERGYEAVTVETIAARAGASRKSFEATFGSKQECAIAALEEMIESNRDAVQAAFERESHWPDSLRAAAYAQARWVVDNPRKTRFGMLETLWVSELTSALRDQLFAEFVAMIDAGREVAADPESIPPLTAESVVGSIAQMVARHSEDRGGRDPIAGVPEMMYLAVRPYLGEEAARRELTIPPPAD
ncbi:MAG TPA: TetR/AcrR family transcriptional regulator [Solirubrobacterales bacterium]|nr:TetR/AcrR family transcriptional regulator [Solirubrobacterales bacterium]